MGDKSVLRDEDITTTWMKAGGSSTRLTADPDSTDPDGSDTDGTDGDSDTGDSGDSDTKDS